MTIGAHDDLARVTQFYITDQIERPDGSILHTTAHQYGALVLIYSHVEDFFPAVDVATARDALRLLLWEKPDDSRKEAQSLSEAGRHEMGLIYQGDKQALAGEMEEVVGRHQAETAAVSPHGRVGGLQVPAFLLHGAGDNVIPPSELLWLEQDVPHGELRAALVSPAISHASMEDKVTFADRLRLVEFMAKVLETEDDQERIAGR
jgi:pimeloyl-ACP methyl ester carboxylesterase